MLYMLCRAGKNANVMHGSLLVVSHGICIVRTVFRAVHCSTQHNKENLSQRATSYHSKECRSLKVPVLLPYQVLPDVIVILYNLE